MFDRVFGWRKESLGCFLLIFLLPLFSAAASQEDIAAMSASGLLSTATGLLSAGDYASATPYLTEYLKRMNDDDDPRLLTMKQAIRLKLGQIYAHIGDVTSAIESLQQYTQHTPCYRPREAWRLLALNLYESGRYQECIDAATFALSRPLPTGLPGKFKAAPVEDFSAAKQAGFSARQIARFEKEAAKGDGEFSPAISSDVPDAEPDYTDAELVSLNVVMAEACSALENWAAAVGPYRFVIEHTVEEDRKGYAIMKMVNALIALKQFDEAEIFILQLYSTNARYDIRVNMALMSAAEALSNEKRYDSALMLYRMVLSRAELVAYQEQKMNELRRAVGLPNVKIEYSTNTVGRVETVFGNKALSGDMATAQFTQDLPVKPDALLKIEAAVVTLISLPPYEAEALYRIGGLYASANRPWEAVAALTAVVKQQPDSELGQRAFAESLLVLVDPLKEFSRVKAAAERFLKSHTEGLGSRMVLHALTVCYQRQGNWKGIKKLLPLINGLPAVSGDRAIRQYDCELYYLQAVADMMLLNYPQALVGFEKILKDFPDLHQQENATYWHAMVQAYQKNYQTALQEFDAYLSAYPHGRWLSETVFHCGVCLFGMERYDEALLKFTQVMTKWPDSRIYPDACSMCGDILASQGKLDEAQKRYEEAIAKAHTVKQDSYALFQMVAMFELEKRYPAMLDAIHAYQARRGETADVAKAAYWIGRIKLAQGRIDEAVAAYLDVITRYGGNISQDGVDLIISELVGVTKHLKGEARQQFQDNLQLLIDKADNQTLKLRLQVMLAEITGSEMALGKKLITELPDLTQAPPPVLAVICDASFAEGNYSRAEEMLNIFQTQFEDSEFIGSAFKLRCYGLFAAGEMKAAMDLVVETQALYGTVPDIAWAQLMKGRINLKLESYGEARADFSAVLGIREWRGEPYAEATYRLGEVEEASGNPRKAFGWYQRAYFQYKGYAHGYWAAEAYLASARCLEKMGLKNDVRNTYRAMLFDRYVNTLPQAEVARKALGPEEVLEIQTWIEQGLKTNITVTVASEEEAIVPAVETNAGPQSVGIEKSAQPETAGHTLKSEETP